MQIYLQILEIRFVLENNKGFPGGLLVRILGFHWWGLGSIPGRGIEIPQATPHSQNNSNNNNNNKCISEETKHEQEYEIRARRMLAIQINTKNGG